jgi:catechol 2,3-dioxygenase-like lactoylglutathione lyase family enzyme
MPKPSVRRPSEDAARAHAHRSVGAGVLVAEMRAEWKSIDDRKERTMLQQFPMYAYIPAIDVARARKFYEGKLGFTPRAEIEGGVFYDCAGGTAAFLYPTSNAGSSRASQAFWQVTDIDKEVADLRARGVVFEHYDMPGQDANGIVTQGGAKAAWFMDTEGNIMAVIQNA